MKTLVQLSILITILYAVSQMEHFVPSKVEPTVVKNPIVEVVKAVEPESAPSLAELKPADVTDGVWEHKDLIARYFPATEVLNALRIASLENGAGDPTKVSKPNRDKWKSKDYGIFQLNDHWQGNRVGGDVEKFKDAETNVRIASEILKDSGNWHLWSTHTKLGL